MNPEVKFRRQIWRVVVLPSLLLVLISAAYFGQVVVLLFVFDRVARKDQLITSAHRTSRLLAEREAGLRDHLASGFPGSLVAYRASEDRLGLALDDLGRLASDDPSQPLILDQVREWSVRWTTIAGEMVASSSGPVRRPVAPGALAAGEELMGEIRRGMTTFIKAEEGARDRLSDEARSWSWSVLAECSGGGIALAVLLTYSSSVRLSRLCKAIDDLQARSDREEPERLDRLSEAIRYYAIFTLDEEGRITSWNSDAERILGYREDEVISRRFSHLYGESGGRSDGPEQDLDWAAREGRADDVRWITRKDGFRFKARVSIVAIRDLAGVLRGYTKVIHEVDAS